MTQDKSTINMMKINQNYPIVNIHPMVVHNILHDKNKYTYNITVGIGAGQSFSSGFHFVSQRERENVKDEKKVSFLVCL